VPVPNFWGYGSYALNDTLLCASDMYVYVYPPILFCIGTVLLFSKERGRRASRLDWTRRWGIICTYVVALLNTVRQFFWMALVLVGISALFMAMPLKYQPGVTRLFVELSTGWLRHGPTIKDRSYCALIIFSSATVLLACVPLWEALCSSGMKRAAKFVLAPLALFALISVAQASLVILGYSLLSRVDPYSWFEPYFRPALLLWNTDDYTRARLIPQPGLSVFVVEAVKWSIIFAIAVWLSVAQLAAWRKNRKS
jgi:hypothetical protein